MPTASNASRPSLNTAPVPVPEILSPIAVRIGTEIFQPPFRVQLELSPDVLSAPVSARVLDSKAREVWRVLPTLADIVDETAEAAVSATAWGFVSRVHELVASGGQASGEAARAAGIADQDNDDDVPAPRRSQRQFRDGEYNLWWELATSVGIPMLLAFLVTLLL